MSAGRKKSRSKSMGPGGLDILKSGAGNRRVSLAVPSRPPPRSILKPTIPLLPEIPPHKPKSAASADASLRDNSDHSGTKVALRTEEEQQAAAREREERERAQLEKEIHDRREARRKSLANRRVSFAAEATLHTFHEVEYVPDNARRTSSAPRPQEHHESDPSEPPSTPPERAEEPNAESPANQRDLHQRKHRRSSGAASLHYDDDTITSTVYDSDLEHADGVTEIHGEEMTDSSDSDSDDGTMMTVEAEEMTSASVASLHSTFGADTTGDLDENLRLATQRATTQRLDEEEEVIAGFAGWGRKNISKETREVVASIGHGEDQDQGSDEEMTMEMDMDMTNAMGGILKPKVTSPERQDEDDDMDMSMDVTRALGGILSQAKPPTRRKSTKPAYQLTSADITPADDQTMEFTTAVGGIKHSRISDVSHLTVDSNEDMSMELTMAVGNVLASTMVKSGVADSRQRTVAAEDDDATAMDMTVAVGRILPEEGMDDDETMGMDMTLAVGGIIKSALAPEARSAAKKIMEQEADEPDPSITASVETLPSRARLEAPVLDENPSPENASKGRGLRRSPSRIASPFGKATQPSLAPVRKVASPTRKLASPARRSASPARQSASPVRRSPTPELILATIAQTPPQAKTPPAMIGSRSSSPVRSASPVKNTPGSPSKITRLFHQDPNTGASTPRVVLTPQGRRLSGVGADRPGLGSPKVAQIFDRRESIGNVASSFLPGQTAKVRRGVAFADPRAMEAEIDKERQDEEEKENSRRILQREADALQEGVENTLSLKEMIQSLSPKKHPLRGRKSLAVGSARGLLGKRPAELDDEEADDTDGVKRLKGHQGSPVKNIRLQSPPSKAETTTGRKTRTSLRSADNTVTDTVTPTTALSTENATTPRGQGRFTHISDDQPTQTMDLDRTTAMQDIEVPLDDDGERIHLQDFLNMTSIRFMELTTTKRRHTVVPSAPRDSLAPDGNDDISLQKCVVAGACTVPMLELYQHSCRELKKYISEGRRIVREIETETFVENPPLFREYISASPEFKTLMDNQFKNVKSHARLLSKAMWYEWRMKLQDGLKEGLVHIAEGMDQDDKILQQQQELLASVLPDLTKRVGELEQEHEDLEAVVRELSECDPAELQKARAELVSMETAISEKTKRIAELRSQLEDSENSIDALSKRKQQCLDEIKEADKVREECRGWSSTEISAIKARTEALEKQHGWAITGISATTISMSYRREIELVFDIAAFQQKSSRKSQPNSRTDVWYIAATRERNPLPSTPEKEFFLQCIRDHVRSLPQSTTPVSHMLGLVSAAWDKANTVAEQTRFLNLTFPTSVARTSDTSITVKSSLLLAPLRSCVEVSLSLQCTPGDTMEVTVSPAATVVYGEQFNVSKMTAFLSSKLGQQVVSSTGEQSKMTAWGDAILELHRKLLARGQKAVAQKA
ncbi:hypothetical protein OQA88_1533 [Cercophora sp. LCS_1]